MIYQKSKLFKIILRSHLVEEARRVEKDHPEMFKVPK